MLNRMCGPAQIGGSSFVAVVRILALCAVASAAGCQNSTLRPINELDLRDEALSGLKAGIRYDASPLIRAQAIEALSTTAPNQGRRYFREALRDPSPAVRFAAAMALGTMEDAGSTDLLRARLNDEDLNVQAAAIFALHRLGEQTHTSMLSDRLLRDPDVEVRRNAALILGQLGEPGSIRLLRHATRDKDESVVLQAHEAMAMLGDAKALQQLALQAYDGAGHRQALALLSMGRTGDVRFVEVLRFRLREGPHLETKLAAARALGELGYPDGLEVAIDAADFDKPERGVPGDAPANQVRRVRTMSALALGAIGDTRALPALKKRLEDQSNPRVQLAAAKSILEILNRDQPWKHSAGSSARTASSNP